MDVDVSNFDEAAESFEKYLKGASFVAMDLEMSGIQIPHARPCMGDTVPEIYRKAKAVVLLELFRQTVRLVVIRINLFENYEIKISIFY